MDFEKAIEKILTAFHEAGIRYALIGGFALGMWGVYRATVDIDFLICREDLEKVDKIMSGLTYQRLHHTENVSQYVSPLGIFGEVDFLHAFRTTSRKMLERAEGKEIFGGKLSIKVLRPEDLVGLKVQAMANDKEREKEELMRLAASSSLRDEMRQLAVRRHDSLGARGEADSDKWIAFLNGYNAFVNHIPKPFRPMIERVMKL